MHREEIINRVVNAYLGDVTAAGKAYRHDGMYHYDIERLTRLMEIFELAMHQERIPVAIRYQVLERVMMAAPDPAETKARVEILKNVAINVPEGWTK